MRDLVTANAAPRALPSWRSLCRGASLVVARAGGVIGQMAVQIAVGALAGPAGIGALQLHMSWSAVLGEVVGGGEPTRAMRDTAVAMHKGAATDIRQSLVRGTGKIFLWSSILGLLFIVLGASGLSHTLGLAPGFLWLSIAIAAPLFALTRLLAETLKALDSPLLAVTIENSAIPVTLLVTCAGIALRSSDASWHITLLLMAAVAGALLAAISLACGVRSQLVQRRDTPNSPTESQTRPTGRTEQLHFWLTGLLNIAFLQLPFLIMPLMVTADEIGRFAVAHKLVNIITTLLILLAAVYAPRFARAAASGDAAGVRRQLRETQLLSLTLFIPVWLALLVLETPLAGLFNLGDAGILDFLLLLGAGQFINAATGLSGVALSMSGGAHRESMVLIVSLMTTLTAALILGQTWGAAGIATACAAGIALRNLASYGFAIRHFKTLEIMES